MCGISGIFHKNGLPVSLEILQKMNRSLVHRGPDDEGYFVKGPVGLGHRRLSIIDLSGGHQPMTTPDGRFTIVFNGEIYNYQEIRADLEKEGVVFITNSDTETLLHLFARRGEKALSFLNGMFAFAVWDEHEKRLFAARDRFGKKPFYYWDTGDFFIFASEPKAFKVHPQFTARLDSQALSHYLQYEYVPAPLCIFEGVKKLPAASYLVVEPKGVRIKNYWEVPLGQSTAFESETQIQHNIVRLLDLATERRLMSEVPLGVFLSGGIDSSAIVALMARHREGKSIKTFSIGFKEKSFDETEHASLIARQFGTDHHSQVLDPYTMLEILPEITSLMDEPFADYSIIPTYLLSKFTRQKVTVALGGDGSDELFAGYPTFFADRVARWFGELPQWMQKLVTGMANALPVSSKDISLDFKAKQFVYGAHFPPVMRNQVWLGAFSPDEQKKLFSEKGMVRQAQTVGPFGTHHVQKNGHPELVEGAPLDLITETMRHCPSGHPGDRMLYFYQKFYLTDDILVKTDRASMAHSLEVRAPFLDVNLVEYVSQLPFELKLHGTQTKYILKKALEGILPTDILYRKKKGFGIPIALWLKGELKGEMLRALDPQKIKKEGLFNPNFVQKLVKDHLSGQKNNRKPLFTLLMFEWWRENFLA